MAFPESPAAGIVGNPAPTGRRQPSLKNAARKDPGMLALQYPKRDQRIFRTLERPRGQ